MEAILRSVLLRQEQMEMQWDAEFEQQKQLFHINTSTLIDMLPIQPRKKRLKLEARVPIPSHDKENLVGFQGFLAKGASVKSPKTIAPHSRRLAKRDLNTRFCDYDVKDAGRIATKLAETQPSLRNCLDVGNLQQNASIVHAIKSTNQDSIGVSVKVEVDEGDSGQMHVFPPTDEYQAGENRKRLRGEQEKNIVLQNRSEQNTKDPEEIRERTQLQTAVVDVAEKETKSKRARKIGKAKECAVEVEAQELSCRDTQTARCNEPEIICKVEVEAEVRTCRDAQVMESENVSKIIEPEIVSEAPRRRGRAKAATTVSQASGKDDVPGIVSKEPVRRGRAKQTSVPQVAQRVTRSRARIVDSVVESEPQQVTRSRVVESEVEPNPEICEKMPSAQVVSKEAAHQEVKVEALCEAEVQEGSPNQTVEGQMKASSKPDVCAPPKEIILDELRSKKSSSSKGLKYITRCARKDFENISVANGLVKRGPSHVDSQEEAVSSRMKSEEQGVVTINSPVAEIVADLKNTNVNHSKDGQHESLPLPQLERIEKSLGHREAAFAPAEQPLASTCEETELQDGNAPSALIDATTAKEETAKNARCSEGDTLDEKIIEDITDGELPTQLQVTEEEIQACISKAPRSSAARLSPCEAANQRLSKYPTLISNVTRISEISRTALPNIKEANTTLLPKVIGGIITPLEKSGDPELSPESLIVAGSRKSSLQSGRISSVAIPLELSEAGNDASASEVHVLPTAGMTRESTDADFPVAGKDGLGEHPVAVLNMLASERQRSESGNVIDEHSIEINGEGSRQTKRESMRDVVMNTTTEVSHVKELSNTGNSKDEASGMDMAREQVKSDAVSPVMYSEARAIEEAIRCSLEQEFHPDVTLTLNRWQFRKRLSPRSKARARRWRSDVATNGVDYGRAQSSDAPAASPSRVVSSRDRSLEGVAYETFLEAQSPEVPVQGVESSFSLGAGKAVDQADTISQQEHASQSERSARRSISSLCNEVLSKALKDGEIGDNSVEYEIMKTADEQNGNPSPLPLLQSIYTLSKACQDMVGARGFLEEGEQQQVLTLIESAKKIMEQPSSGGSQAVGAPPNTPALNNSRFHGHTNLYPDRFRLFISPRSSPAAPPSSSTFLSSAAPEDASLLPGDIESTSPQMKHLIQETTEKAVSRAPYLDSVLSESAVRADHVSSPAPSRPPSSGKLMTNSDAGDIDLLGEGENALKCSPAVGTGSKRFTAVDSIQVHLASDVRPSRVVPGTSTVGPAIPLPNVSALQSCDGSTQLTGGLLSAVELVKHQSEGPLDLETVAERKLSELRSRFYALSKDYVGTSSTEKDLPNLLGDGPESLISHSTNPPSPIPNLRFSPGYASKGAHLSVKKTLRSPTDVHFDAGENEESAAVVEEETRIPCSPIFIGNQRERVDLEREGTSEPAEEEPVACSESIDTAGPASMLRVEPQGSSNLNSDVPSILPSNPIRTRSNLVSSMRSFIPLVQQQQPAAPYPNGKRDVKVRALEAAEAAKRLAEQKELEKQERKKAAELAKREKQERAAQEKLAKREKAAQEKLKQQEARAERENEEASKRKAVAAGPTKSVMSDSTNSQGANSQNVLLKVKKTHELKLKMDQEKQERLLEEQRRKEEEWRKKEAENAARKRKHEAAEKKEREEKRRRQEEAMKAHREMEERQRLELEKKTLKQRALEEMEKERKAIEEELKRQKRLDKEREVEQRRKKEEEKELAWLDMKEATRKRKEEAAKQIKLLEAEGRQQAVKIRRPSEDPAMPSTGPYHSFMASLHIAMGIGEGVGAHLAGVNSVVDPPRVSSLSLAGPPLRVLQHSAEGTGAIALPCRNSQAALRVPRTTPESVPGVSNVISGSGKSLFPTPPEASIAVSSGGGSTAGVLRDRINILQAQCGSKTGASAVVADSKPCQPGQVGFTGPPGGMIGAEDKGLQSYEISPFRDSEDEDSEEEEKRSQKPIPQWARKENMLSQLVKQLEQDPDDIFAGASSCSLDDVFKVKGSKKRPDFRRRGSSGDWAKDCLTWQEEIQYKVSMGYLH